MPKRHTRQQCLTEGIEGTLTPAPRSANIKDLKMQCLPEVLTSKMPCSTPASCSTAALGMLNLAEPIPFRLHVCDQLEVLVHPLHTRKARNKPNKPKREADRHKHVATAPNMV